MEDRNVDRYELAAILGVTSKTVGSYVKHGRVPQPSAPISTHNMLWKASVLRKFGLSVPAEPLDVDRPGRRKEAA